MKNQSNAKTFVAGTIIIVIGLVLTVASLNVQVNTITHIDPIMTQSLFGGFTIAHILALVPDMAHITLALYGLFLTQRGLNVWEVNMGMWFALLVSVVLNVLGATTWQGSVFYGLFPVAIGGLTHILIKVNGTDTIDPITNEIRRLSKVVADNKISVTSIADSVAKQPDSVAELLQSVADSVATLEQQVHSFADGHTLTHRELQTLLQSVANRVDNLQLPDTQSYTIIQLPDDPTTQRLDFMMLIKPLWDIGIINKSNLATYLGYGSNRKALYEEMNEL